MVSRFRRPDCFHPEVTMSAAPFVRRYSSALLCLAGTLAFVGLALIVPPGQNAQAADAVPHASAGYQTTERLTLDVRVPAAVGKAVEQNLIVELVGSDDKVIDEASR